MKFVIEYRINDIDCNGKIKRGRYIKWKSYKTLEGMIDALIKVRQRNYGGTSQIGDKIFKTQWQFKPKIDKL